LEAHWRLYAHSFFFWLPWVRRTLSQAIYLFRFGQLHQAASRSELLLQLALVFPSVSICS
jgi:hypothetical protein